MLLLAWSAVVAQPRPQPLRQQMIDAVRNRDERALLVLIGDQAGRQELLSLSDSFVFEIRVAKMLAASLPQSPDDSQAVRRTELSLLHQTDNDGVAQELFVGLLSLESREVTDPSVATALADVLYDDLHKDLNDYVVRAGKVVSGEKTRALEQIATSILKTRPNPGQQAFLKHILARTRVPHDQVVETPGTQARVSVRATAPIKTPARKALGKEILTGVGVLLMVSLVVALGWRIRLFF